METTISVAEEASKEQVDLTGKKVIALTFDDGPNTTTTVEMLDQLEKYEVVASFFVVGNSITEESGEVMKRAYDMGCEIGNHSQTHSDMTKMTEEDIREEIRYTSDMVEEITGEAPHFFRPPYISVNDTMFDAIDLPFISGYGANDWEDTVTAEQRASKILDQVSDGSIILLHDMAGNSKTVEALDLLIPALLEDGYTFVTISDLFAAKGVTPAGDEKIVYSDAEQTSMY